MAALGIGAQYGLLLPFSRKHESEADEKMNIKEDTATTGTTTSNTVPTAVATPPSEKIDDDVVSLESLSATPTSTLVAYQLPVECNEIMLHVLFQQYIGYQPPVRMIPSTSTTPTPTTTDDTTSSSQLPQPPYGIITFDTDTNATNAYNTLNGFQLSTKETLQLTYMKNESTK